MLQTEEGGKKNGKDYETRRRQEILFRDGTTKRKIDDSYEMLFQHAMDRSLIKAMNLKRAFEPGEYGANCAQVCLCASRSG
jgi:hypothetical protein